MFPFRSNNFISVYTSVQISLSTFLSLVLMRNWGLVNLMKLVFLNVLVILDLKLIFILKIDWLFNLYNLGIQSLRFRNVFQRTFVMLLLFWIVLQLWIATLFRSFGVFFLLFTFFDLLLILWPHPFISSFIGQKEFLLCWLLKNKPILLQRLVYCPFIDLNIPDMLIDAIIRI